MGKKVVLCSTMDTKADEALFLKEEIERNGLDVIVVDMGMSRKSPDGVDISQAEVAGENLERILSSKVRSEAINMMTDGLKRVVRELYEEKKLDAIISLGGSGGTTMASAAMHELPIGIPKLIVTTMASGNTLPYVQGEDILLLNPVVDVQNLNFLTRYMLKEAASILTGMIEAGVLSKSEKKAIAISCFGVTTPCVDRLTARLEALGYEVLIFHARGVSGGKIMEKMIRSGYFSGVIDVTTTEIIDEVAGGIYPVGDERLRGAVKMGIPYIVVPGALEMINLGTEDSLTETQKARMLYKHSPASVKMRADANEMKKAAALFAERLGCSIPGRTEVIIPLKGFDNVDSEGKVFWLPEADKAFIDELSSKLPATVAVTSVDCHINDEAFAETILARFLSMMEKEEK